jgi:hypothetical protein
MTFHIFEFTPIFLILSSAFLGALTFVGVIVLTAHFIGAFFACFRLVKLFFLFFSMILIKYFIAN